MSIYDKFKAAEQLFQCPFCKSGFRLTNSRSMICKNNHCYDLSAKGYINFLPQAQNKKYTKTLFESRQATFQSGLYQGVEEKVLSIISVYLETKEKATILDVGCGEGYYSRSISDNFSQKTQILAFDNVKDAIKLASHKQDNICWMVADLTCIPLKDESIDILLDILTPSNYSEFTRLLSKNGILIKIIPRSDYLIELRNQLSPVLQKKAYSNEPILKYFKEHFAFVEQTSITYTRQLSLVQKKSLYQMTPLTFDIDLTTIDPMSLDSVTIDLDILVGSKNKAI